MNSSCKTTAMTTPDEDLEQASTLRGTSWGYLLDSYNKKVNLLQEKREEIQQGHEDLARCKEEFADKTHNKVSDDDVIEINAGGVPFSIPRGTLTYLKGTRLEALFSGRWDNKVLRDSNGRVFLDVSPTCFQSVLDYLSELRVSPPDDLPNQPYVEAEDQMYLDYLTESFGIFESEDGLVINSTILDEAEQIQSLYNFLSEEDTIDSSNLDLLYRGSRDGFNSTDFHELCDDKGPTVTIIKDREGNIFGGYLDKSWNNYEGWIASENAFLFLLRNRLDTQTAKMKLRGHRNDCAAYCSPEYGPMFGEFDIQITSNCDVNRCSSHVSTFQLPQGETERVLTGHTSFRVFEIEVHKVTGRNNTSQRSTTNVNSDNETEEDWASMTFDEFPDGVKDAFLQEQKATASANEELQKQLLAFEKEKAFVEHFSSTKVEPTEEIITFSVSGKTLETRRSTLSIMKDSVLAKHFDDPLWASERDYIENKVKDWKSSDITEWINDVEGLSIEDAAILNEQSMSGLELLALESEHLEKMGIARVATQALIMKKIRELDEKSTACNQNIMMVEHSSYCFGKILDHLRFLSFCQSKEETQEIPLPIIRKAEQKRFQRIVDYYFPCETSFFFSDIPSEISELTDAITQSIVEARKNVYRV